MGEQLRIIFTLGGEATRLSATLDHIVSGGLGAAQGIEVMKYAASTSKIQQPSNVGPCYRSVKQARKWERVRVRGRVRVDSDVSDDDDAEARPPAKKAGLCMGLDKLTFNRRAMWFNRPPVTKQVEINTASKMAAK